MLDAFTFEDQTRIYESCSAVLNGEMLVFGGYSYYERQWSSVGSCSLRSEGKLDFDFRLGACNTVQAKFFRPHTMNYIICKQTSSYRIVSFIAVTENTITDYPPWREGN